MEKEAIVTEIYSYGSFPLRDTGRRLYNHEIHFNNNDVGLYVCEIADRKDIVFKIGESIKYTIEKRNLRRSSYNKIKPI